MSVETVAVWHTPSAGWSQATNTDPASAVPASGGLADAGPDSGLVDASLEGSPGSAPSPGRTAASASASTPSESPGELPLALEQALATRSRPGSRRERERMGRFTSKARKRRL